jgi:hypothetical protein
VNRALCDVFRLSAVKTNYPFPAVGAVVECSRDETGYQDAAPRPKGYEENLRYV